MRNGDIVTSTKWFVNGSLQIDGPDDQPTVKVLPLANTGIVGMVRVEITISNLCIGKCVANLYVYSALQDYSIGIKRNGGAACLDTVLDIPNIIDTSEKTYSLDLNPAYLASIGTILTYSWSTTGGLSIIGATNQPTALVSHTSNGTISLEITSTGLCVGKGRKTLAVKIGVPIMLSSTILSNIPCISRADVVFAEDVTSISYTRKLNSSTITVPTTTGMITLVDDGRYTIFGTNACGNSINYYVTVTSDELAGCKTVAETPKKSENLPSVLPEIVVSPNPANTYIDVANILAGSEVKIYTKMGVLVHSEKSENDKIRLDISKLATDLYILEAVLPNKVKVRKQIVKE